MNLRLAGGLSLPAESATQTFLIVGKRGSGKSSTAARLAEQMMRREIPVAVLDPVDVWWGLKAGEDGQPEGGLKVYIFGGEHADLPLESSAGTLMADVLIDHRVSAVFVLRTFSNREKARFVSEFAEQLFKRNRDVLHLFAEEAHEMMPQQTLYKGTGEEEMLGRMLRLQKLGRTSGIGVTCITQRPASLNKNATTQAEILIAHRILGPQDRDAVEDWIKYHRQQEKKRDVLETLGELKTGEAWLWAPDFPEDAPLGLRRIKVLAPETFDSRRTPKPGERRVQPKALAPVDLETLRSKMAATIDRAKAEDPRELRRQVAELRQELARTKNQMPVPAEPKIIEVPIITEAHLSRLEKAIERLDAERDRLAQAQQVVVAEMGLLRDVIAKVVRPAPGRVPIHRQGTRDHPILKIGEFRKVKSRPSSLSGQGDLTGPEQRIVDALAWLESLGQTDSDQVAVAFLAHYRVGGGAFNNPKGRLHGKGLVEYVNGRLRLTPSGRQVANLPEEALTVEELQERVMRRLPGPAQRILAPLLKVYPKPMSKEDLAAEAGYSQGGAFNNPLGRMRTLGLVEYPSAGMVAAKSVLFLEG